MLKRRREETYDAALAFQHTWQEVKAVLKRRERPSKRARVRPGATKLPTIKMSRAPRFKAPHPPLELRSAPGVVGLEVKNAGLIRQSKSLKVHVSLSEIASCCRR